jgi:hypothetical protein
MVGSELPEPFTIQLLGTSIVDFAHGSGGNSKKNNPI